VKIGRWEKAYLSIYCFLFVIYSIPGNRFFSTADIGLSLAFFTFSKTNTMEQSTATTKTMSIKPSASSSQNDFDFLEGKWKVHNRKLKTRLNNSNEWSEFESALHLRKVLTGIGCLS